MTMTDLPAYGYHNPPYRQRTVIIAEGTACPVCGAVIRDGRAIFPYMDAWIHGACRVLLGGEL